MNVPALICNGAGRGQSAAARGMLRPVPEGERSPSRQVSTDEGWDMDKGGEHYDDVHTMACSIGTSENKPNTRSEEDRSEGHRAQQTLPPLPKNAPQLQSWSVTMPTPAQILQEIWTPPPWSTEYNMQPHTQSPHNHRISHPASSQGTTDVRPTYSPSTTTHKAILCSLDRLSLQDPRQQTPVGRAENFCLGRLHLHTGLVLAGR